MDFRTRASGWDTNDRATAEEGPGLKHPSSDPRPFAIPFRQRCLLYFFAAFANLPGNWAMIPSLSTSAMPRMCSTTRS